VNHECLRVDGEQPFHEGQVERIEVASVGNHKDFDNASTAGLQNGNNCLIEGAVTGGTFEGSGSALEAGGAVVAKAAEKVLFFAEGTGAGRGQGRG
jgi:hypothetical protein